MEIGERHSGHWMPPCGVNVLYTSNFAEMKSEILISISSVHFVVLFENPFIISSSQCDGVVTNTNWTKVCQHGER